MVMGRQRAYALIRNGPADGGYLGRPWLFCQLTVREADRRSAGAVALDTAMLTIATASVICKHTIIRKHCVI